MDELRSNVVYWLHAFIKSQIFCIADRVFSMFSWLKMCVCKHKVLFEQTYYVYVCLSSLGSNCIGPVSLGANRLSQIIFFSESKERSLN